MLFMKKCGKCGGPKSHSTVLRTVDAGTVTLDSPDFQIAEVSFRHNRILRSSITGNTIRVIPGETVKVYMNDLLGWINNGVNGVKFESLEDEADFIERYGKVPSEYA